MSTSPTADTSVRVAWFNDALGIAGIQVAAWHEAYADLLPPDVLDSMGIDDVAAAWHASLSKPKDARDRVLVALERNRIVGFAITSPAADPDSDPVADGEIAEFSVLPDERGKGHGSRLLHACVDTLVADRFSRAVLWLRSTDDTLREFFGEAGWEPDSAHRELDLHGDGSVTVKQIRLHTTIA
jgi:GNAT superfamily N-acetyltransferase